MLYLAFLKVVSRGLCDTTRCRWRQHEWCTKWRLRLNTNKCCSIQFSFSTQEPANGYHIDLDNSPCQKDLDNEEETFPGQLTAIRYAKKRIQIPSCYQKERFSELSKSRSYTYTKDRSAPMKKLTTIDTRTVTIKVCKRETGQERLKRVHWHLTLTSSTIKQSLIIP